jgi:hypothetical protein
LTAAKSRGGLGPCPFDTLDHKKPSAGRPLIFGLRLVVLISAADHHRN